jgi:hypothetical protein
VGFQEWVDESRPVPGTPMPEAADGAERARTPRWTDGSGVGGDDFACGVSAGEGLRRRAAPTLRRGTAAAAEHGGGLETWERFGGALLVWYLGRSDRTREGGREKKGRRKKAYLARDELLVRACETETRPGDVGRWNDYTDPK